MPFIPFDAPPEPPPVLNDLATLWGSFLRWLLEAGQNILQIILIIAICVGIAFVLRLVIRRVVTRIVSSAKLKANVDDTQALERSPLADMRLVQRTRTLGSVLTNIINVTIFTVTVLLIINQIDQTVLGSFALLTAAVGAGLGFGAQNIVKDALNGLFMVMEDQLGVGDVVDVGPTTGVVEAVGIRITQIRDVNGTLWFVRNGEILTLGNSSQGWGRAVIDVTVDASNDMAEVEKSALTAARSLLTAPDVARKVTGEPEVWGIESAFGDRATMRLALRTRPEAQWAVQRALRAALMREFDKAGIKLATEQPKLPGTQA